MNATAPSRAATIATKPTACGSPGVITSFVCMNDGLAQVTESPTDLYLFFLQQLRVGRAAAHRWRESENRCGRKGIPTYFRSLFQTTRQNHYGIITGRSPGGVTCFLGVSVAGVSVAEGEDSGAFAGGCEDS